MFKATRKYAQKSFKISPSFFSCWFHFLGISSSVTQSFLFWSKKKYHWWGCLSYLLPAIQVGNNRVCIQSISNLVNFVSANLTSVTSPQDRIFPQNADMFSKIFDLCGLSMWCWNPKSDIFSFLISIFFKTLPTLTLALHCMVMLFNPSVWARIKGISLLVLHVPHSLVPF